MGRTTEMPSLGLYLGGYARIGMRSRGMYLMMPLSCGPSVLV